VSGRFELHGGGRSIGGLCFSCSMHILNYSAVPLGLGGDLRLGRTKRKRMQL
jgi:hypothetical protein